MQNLIIINAVSKLMQKLTQIEQIKRCKTLEISSNCYLELILFILMDNHYDRFMIQPWNPPNSKPIDNDFRKYDIYLPSRMNEKMLKLSKENNIDLKYYFFCSIKLCRDRNVSWNNYVLFPFGIYKECKSIIIDRKHIYDGMRMRKAVMKVVKCGDNESLKLIDYIHAIYLGKRSDRKSNRVNERIEDINISKSDTKDKCVVMQLTFSYNMDT